MTMDLIKSSELEQTAGISATYLDYVIEDQLKRITPKTVVDFGAGAGKIGRLVRHTGMFWKYINPM